MHPSVVAMWSEYTALRGTETETRHHISSWHFCDNEQDADECARLVLTGKKRATAPSLWSITSEGERLPEAGDLHVITNWAGEAQCVIRVAGVETLPFDEITDEHARAEGEGDGTLEWWRDAHWAYYGREMENAGRKPTAQMLIVFTRFEVVYPEDVARACAACA